jgi:hypothetical protein
MDDDQKPSADKKSDNQKDNLIPFPVDRIKKKRQIKALAGKLLDKKATLFLSIAVLVLGAGLVNSLILKEDRYLANNERGFIVDSEAEKRLVSELSDPKNRGPASFGREPSAEDQLRSVDLHSRYQLVHEDGMVIAISLQPGAGVALSPIYIKNRQEFLERYKKIIAPGFESVEPVADLDAPNLSQETYLLKRGPASVGKAHFELDRSGAFHSLKVEVISK